MISVSNSKTQEIEQYETIILSDVQSVSCAAQLRDNVVTVAFPGVYALQWSVTSKLKNAGKMKIQAYNHDKPIPSSFVTDKSPANILRTMCTAPVMLVFKKPEESIAISLKNIGGALSISNVVLSITKVF